jgi:tetratricopeptide (TPR) repeat protein
VADGEETGNPVFERGLKALEQEQYAQAAQIFDKLLVAKPATESDLVTVYNSGAAHEGLGHCLKSAERYREVVRASAGKFRLLEGQALFRLSLMYECLGQDTKTITSLLEARKKGREGLPFETLNAEIPSRLAAAYARIGNRQKALEYFGQASEGLKKMVAQTANHKQKELLGRTLYLMGQLNSAQRNGENDASTFMQSLSMQQPYLLQAIEMDYTTWSKKAADDLQKAYDNIWHYKFSDDASKREFYTRGLQSIQELRKIRLPDSPPSVNAVFAHLDKVEQQLHTELSKVAETNKLTPDAEKREGLKRTGRLVDPVELKKQTKAKAKR